MTNDELKKLQKLASGYTADVFILDDDRVLKLYREGWEQQLVQNEYHVGTLISSYGIRAPKVYDMITCNNRNGIIFQRLRNVTMKDQLVSSPKQWRSLSIQMAKAHSDINAISDVKCQLLSQKDAYRKLINTRSSITQQQKEKLIHRLDEKPELNQICHGDFHPINLLYEKDEWYIIDWLGALRGDPHADVAGSYLIMSIMGEEAMPDKTLIGKKLQSYLLTKFTRQYLDEYRRLTGTKLEDILYWLPIRAATYLDVGLSDAANKKLLKVINTHV